MLRTSLKNYRFSGQALSSAQGQDLECIIAPVSLLKSNRASLLSSLSGDRWASEEIREQFSKKAKQAVSELNGPDADCASFSVTFSSGGLAVFLFIEPELPTYDLHTQLRQIFASALKDFANESGIILQVRHLDADDQARVLSGLVFLQETIHWQPVRFGAEVKKPGTKKTATAKTTIVSSLREADAKALVEKATQLALTNNEVRTLADLPANELNPANYRERISAFAKDHGLAFEFWDRKELARRKAGAFLAVTRADPNTAGGIAHLKYIPKSASKKKGRAVKKLVLVGKGICFDTGGYNIKPGMSMLGMHGDMTGSALALSLCGYFARTGADFEVHAYLALAENLISATAYKPNEVVIASDGTAIEVVDTDAEGRMVLADTLAFARKEKADLLIDYATLTGAAIRALDRRKSAVFSNRADLAERAVQCGTETGERMWHFPIDSDYRKNLKSRIADIIQCSESNNADHIYAAAFLSHFVGKETPWVHVDLVACENKGGLGLIGSDTTGFGVLWTDLFVESVLKG